MFVMHEVKATEYGLYLRVKGSPDPVEGKIILAEIHRVIKTRKTGFCVFSDLREMKLMSDDSQAICLEVQQLILSAGVKRAAVILGNATVAYQFKRLSLQSGMFDFHRYIDSSNEPDWERKGLEWLTKEIDPDAEWREEIARKRLEQENSISD